MSASTVTSKGQITIPVDIRNLLNIRVGDVLEFLVEEDGKIKLYPQSKDIQDLKTLLPKPKKKLTVDEMNDIIAKRGGGKIK
jgi:AbrB family looped-hinge helix DNA binding protein